MTDAMPRTPRAQVRGARQLPALACCATVGRSAAIVLLQAALLPAALAHGPGEAELALDPWAVVPLSLTAWLYLRGVRNLWRHAGVGRGISLRQALLFTGGWLTLVFALVWPLERLAAQLFSAHMVQHELLMVVAAPLFVLARPLGAWAWAVPVRWRCHLHAGISYPAVRVPWRAATAPLGAWLLHALALWLWHVPAFFSAASDNAAIHALQHLCFLASALLFWWAVLGPRTRRHRATGVLLLFTTMMHMGVLGALVTLAPSVLYEPYVATTLAWGLDPLEDQQLGGLVMWVPAGTAYLLAGLYLASRLLADERPLDAFTGSAQ